MDNNRTRQLLGCIELDWLVRSLRKRFEAGHNGGRMALPKTLSLPQRDALSRLLGRRVAQGVRSLSLTEVEDVLQSGDLAPSLRAAIEVVSGPCVVRSEVRTLEDGRWNQIFSEARARVENGRIELHTWLQDLQSTGILRRLSENDIECARALLTRAVGIVALLPSKGIALTELAASTTGDSHALDPGQSLATLVLRAAAVLSGAADRPSDAAGRRSLWESVGVFCDEVSSSVLVLNLEAASDTLCGKVLAAHAHAGEPCRLTLREMLRHPPEWGQRYRDRVIYVCENPTVVATAADRLGARSAPIICIEGKPRTPVSHLLRLLVEAGARLRYHGDFDWEGIRIAQFVMKRFSAEPWRMGCEDYDAAIAKGAAFALSGEPTQADWDSGLCGRMTEVGKVVHEEAVMDLLCLDLAGA